MGLVGNMDNGSILDIGSCTDLDVIDIATDNDMIPETWKLPYFHIADNFGRANAKNRIV